jgi:hypothetical protein
MKNLKLSVIFVVIILLDGNLSNAQKNYNLFLLDSSDSIFRTNSDDHLILQPRTWNWISFPRLDREGNEPVPSQALLENIDPFPSYLQLKHYLAYYDENKDKTYDLETGWSGDLENVQSTLGYKLETDNETVSTLPMTGTVLDAGTTMPLYGLKSNWAGYFLPAVQSPFEAIGAEFLEDINSLKGQYWSCYKKDPGHTKNSGSVWACACQQGRVEINYGEMIEIHATDDIPAFHWQMAGMQQQPEPKPPSLSFQFVEQPEYDALFIELDSLALPDEIGAFAGDSCIGATTVLAGDTMALVCAYTEGFEGEEITFELLYPTKSARPRCRDYSVLNPATGIREKRRIVAGENQPYFLVSLKSQDITETRESGFNMRIRPNPATDQFTVSYFIGRETPVEFCLFNALGLQVDAWQRGSQSAGNYSLTISAAALPSGCYYLKARAGYEIEMQKVIIIN